jgi:hypothetical protein
MGRWQELGGEEVKNRKNGREKRDIGTPQFWPFERFLLYDRFRFSIDSW